MRGFGAEQMMHQDCSKADRKIAEQEQTIAALEALKLRWNKAASKHVAGSEFIDDPERVFSFVEKSREFSRALAAECGHHALSAIIGTIKELRELLTQTEKARDNYFIESERNMGTAAILQRDALRERNAELEAATHVTQLVMKLNSVCHERDRALSELAAARKDTERLDQLLLEGLYLAHMSRRFSNREQIDNFLQRAGRARSADPPDGGAKGSEG